MAAQEHLNQLQMFMPAGHIRENYPTVDAGLEHDDEYDRDNESYARARSNEEMDYKLDVAKSGISGFGYSESLYDNIKRRGIEKPVALHSTISGVPAPSWSKGWLGNGGHRVAAAADINPSTEVPVEHTGEFHQANQDLRHWGTETVMKRHQAAPSTKP